MGWFNAGSKESNESTVTNVNQTYNTDSRMVTDGNGVGLNMGSAAGNSIAILDGGAIGALDLTARSGLWDQHLTSVAALNTVNDVASNSLAAAGITMDRAFAANQSVMRDAAGLLSSASSNQSADFRSLLGATTLLAQQAYGAMNSNLGLAKDLNQASQTAYSDASQQAAGNKNIVLVGMAVVGLAVVMMWGKH